MSGASGRPVRESTDDSLLLVCDNCGASGVVRRDRLRGLLHCRGCGAFYQLGDCGRLIERPAPPLPAPTLRVAVRSWNTTWEEHEVPDPEARLPELPGPRLRSRSGHLGRLPTRRTVAVVVVVLLVVLAAWLVWLKRPRPAPPPLPTDLEARARLWAEAWLKRDTALLLRLTDPSQDRALRRELSRSVPPDWVSQEGIRSATFEVIVSRLPDRSAEVTVRVARADGGSGPVLQQFWVEKQGTWYFVPSRPAPPRRQQPAPGAGQRGKKLPS